MPQAEDYISLEGFISTPLDAALARILPDSYLGGSSGIGGWSARSTFQRCPYSYYRKFVSPLKANVIGGGERPSEALETGALFHLLLAFLYRYTYKKQEWPILVEVLRQRLLDDGVNGNVVNEAFRIFAAYRFRYEGEAIEPIAVEERAEYEGISCRYDLIAKLDGATWIIEHKSSSRADSATLEGWHNEGGVLGQLYLWKKLRLDRRFGPLAGLIVNITVKTKTVQFYRVQVPVTQARLTEHMRDLRLWEAYIGLSKATGNWPRNRASCVGRYGKCLLFQHCMGV